MDAAQLIIVIPTRNRAELAVNAVNSVLAEAAPNRQIFVSDNSTSESEVQQLAKFCAGLQNKHVHYLRPPVPLSMTRHYDWLIRQALEIKEASHFLLLTDRMVFLTGQFKDLLRVWRSQPDKIFTYGHNRLVDHNEPVRLELSPWTGQVIELNAAHLLRLSARMHWHVSLPRMMNCIVPRHVFAALLKRYGNLFDSIAPDFNFCYRSLELCDSIIYYDAYPLLHYALGRSNGESQVRGIATKDHLDFIANLGGQTFNFAAPVPAIMTVGNAITHEYCFVQREVPASSKLPPVDREKYLDRMAFEVEGLENPALREDMRKLLASEGWSGAPKRQWAARLRTDSFRALLKSLVLGLKSLRAALIAHPTRLWREMMSRRFGLYPANRLVTLEFANRAEAIAFANRHPRPRQKDDRFLAALRGQE